MTLSQTHVETLVAATVAEWPEHARFLDRSLSALPPDLAAHAETTADQIIRLAGGKPGRLVAGYRWMCNMLLEEELIFRRTGAYRYSSFAEVNAAVYQTPDIMHLYMDGVLLSQVLWRNHLEIGHFYENTFLANSKAGGAHLEIGPGHGMLLYKAAQRNFATIEGWDVSPTSISHTRDCLARLGMTRPVDLTAVDLFRAEIDGSRFDSITLSEVLEHLETPREALERIRRLLRPDGRLFVNVPINSPAIDHIFLLRSPDEAWALVKSAGYEIEQTCVVPMSGYNLERATRHQVTVSCALICRPLP